jgi:hypothetical protein
MSTSVRLFWWLVLIFATSFAVAVVTWTAGELVGGADAALDNATLVAFITAMVSALLLMIIGPNVFHDRFRQTRAPHDGTMGGR